MNLFTNLQKLLEKLQSHIETPIEANGKLSLTLKQEVANNPDKYLAFIQSLDSLKTELALEHFIEQKFITKLVKVKGFDQPLPICEKIQYQVDTTSLHIDRLRDFFHSNITKLEVSESMSFLLANGWTEEKIQSELNLSRSTYFRYLKTQPLKATTVNQTPIESPCNA